MTTKNKYKLKTNKNGVFETAYKMRTGKKIFSFSVETKIIPTFQIVKGTNNNYHELNGYDNEGNRFEFYFTVPK